MDKMADVTMFRYKRSASADPIGGRPQALPSPPARASRSTPLAFHAGHRCLSPSGWSPIRFAEIIAQQGLQVLDGPATCIAGIFVQQLRHQRVATSGARIPLPIPGDVEARNGGVTPAARPLR